MPTYAKYLKFTVGRTHTNGINASSQWNEFIDAEQYPYDDDTKTQKIMRAFSDITGDGDTVDGYDGDANYELYTKAADLGYRIKASNLNLIADHQGIRFTLEFWFPTTSIYNSFTSYFDSTKKTFFNAVIDPNMLNNGHDASNLEQIDNVDYAKAFPS